MESNPIVPLQAHFVLAPTEYPMSDVIKVKFLPATNTKPGRFKAYCESHNIGERVKTVSVTDTYDYQGCGFDTACRLIAEKLARKLGWKSSITKRMTLPNHIIGIRVNMKEASWIFFRSDSHLVPRTCQCQMQDEGLCELCQIHESQFTGQPHGQCQDQCQCCLTR